MKSADEDLFANPYWHALLTEHAAFAVGSGLARRYPPEVVPFAGLRDNSPEAMAALRELLAPGEAIYVTGDDIVICGGVQKVSQLPGLQMQYPPWLELPAASSKSAMDDGLPPILELGAEDAPDMVALTDVAFPGYFRAETYRMGAYYGIRIGGVLVAMGGQRLALPDWREISALCTHPAHTGKGYAARLIGHIMRVHRSASLESFLHVGAANARAIQLYHRLGFVTTRPILFNRVRRAG